MNRMLAVILGGGAGTRLFPLTRDRAKPAVPLAGKYRLVDVPISNYSSSNYDALLLDGKVVGLSLFTGYSHNERKELSLGVIDPSIDVGTEVTLVWGEPDGGSQKASVERPHKQVEVRATVSPVPYSSEAREHYAEGWRVAGRA